MTLLDKIIKWVEKNKEDTEFSDCSYSFTIDYKELMEYLTILKKLEDKLSAYKKAGITDTINNIQRYDLEWEWMAEYDWGDYVKYKDIKKIIKTFF